MADLSPDLIAAAMRRLNCHIDTNPGEVNVFYVEGMNRDGTRNDDAPDKWNDLRGVITFANEKPVMAGLWDNVTTKPGFYYDSVHVINSKGAAIIALGQQSCWQVGFHHQNPQLPALVQTGAPVKVWRDSRHDFSRNGTLDVGDFGINQHAGGDSDPKTIGHWSAGCLVARSVSDHLQFMALVKNDPRYIADHGFVFATTVMQASDVIEKSLDAVA